MIPRAPQSLAGGVTLRHEPGVDVLAGCRRFASALDATLADAEDRPDLLRPLLDVALSYAGFVAVHDTDSLELDRALRVAVQAGVGLFAHAAAAGERVDVALGARLVRQPALGPHPDANADAWRSAFLASVVCRDRRACDLLAATPSHVLQASGVLADSSLLLRVRALQAFWSGRAEAGALVEAALLAADPSRLRAAPADLVLAEVVPELEMLRAVIAGDGKELDRALFRALEAHKRYRGATEDRDDARYFIALGPLGLCALADERGVWVEPRSDYTPLRLVRGEVEPAGRRREPAPSLDVSAQTVLLCHYCGSSVTRHGRSCSTCESDLTHTRPIELEMSEFAAAERSPCRRCGEPILRRVFVCPCCGTWQAEVEDDEAAETEEVPLRPFPPEYQVYVVAPNFGPSRLLALLPGEYAPTAEDAVDRLRKSGIEVLDVGAARFREAPEAPWELVIEARAPGDQGAFSMQVWPLPIDAVGDEDRVSLGHLGALARFGLLVFTHLGPDLLRDLHRQLTVTAALAGDTVGVLDVETGRVRTARWLRDAVASPVPPDPAELYAIRTVRSPDGRRVWMHTLGLPRGGCFELEMLDVPVEHADRFAELLDGTARAMLERGDSLPAEEQMFSVGTGIDVAWVPLAWGKEDLAPGAFAGSDVDRVRLRGLSAAVVAPPCEDGMRTAPIASLAQALSGGVGLHESKLDADRDRLLVGATLDRFVRHLRARGADPSWQFLAKMEVGEDRLWFRVHGVSDGHVDASLLGEPPPSAGMRRGHRERRRTDEIVDWEIENRGGRITPADVLEDRAQAQRTLPETSTDELFRDAEGRATRRPSATPTLLDIAVSPHPRGRSPSLAAFLSLLVPGAGQIYLGETGRGLLFMGLSLVTLSLCGAVNVVAAGDAWRRGAIG
jgi:hypothetical protein